MTRQLMHSSVSENKKVEDSGNPHIWQYKKGDRRNLATTDGQSVCVFDVAYVNTSLATRGANEFI